jgi:hypothetical protein
MVVSWFKLTLVNWLAWAGSLYSRANVLSAYNHLSVKSQD